MTNEEPVPSTSSVLSAAEKNVKIAAVSKKRKGLDIDALWRKKFKDVENQKSPEKPPEEASKPNNATEDEKEKSKESPEVSSKSETSSKPAPTTITTSKEPTQTTRSTRSSRKKEMNEMVEDVKPNIKLLKKSIAFQCSNIEDGAVVDVPTDMLDPNKISLHSAAVVSSNNYGEESQDEMEVMQRSGDDSNGTREDYDYAQIEYTNAVTPNGTYTLYGPDSTYTPYYPYNNNMQSSPQDNTAPYLVPAAPQSPVSIDDQDSVSLPNNQRASPATVTWLFENYEIAEGSSLPRCQLYDHYRKHCAEHRMDPVNAASFGKLIRSVFHNLKTRRLGTRGNSKYHYYGIRMKDSSTLHSMPQQPQQIHQTTYTPPMQMSQRDAYADTVNQVAAVKYVDVEIPSKRLRKDNSSSSSSCRDSASPGLELPSQQSIHQTTVSVIPQPPVQTNGTTTGVYTFTESDKAALGKLDMPRVSFQNQDALLSTISFRKLGLGAEELNNLIENYYFMCRDVLDLVKNVEFTAVEDVWQKFWAGNLGISHEVLLALCTLERIQEYLIEVDLALYQTIVDCLIPNVLLSELSAGMTQSCRTFAKNIDVYLRKALINGKIADSFIKKKIQAIKYMQQGLKRYTSLNHLAHAARGVLMKPEQCQQMYQDYIRVDINTVHQQAGWICGCDSVMVMHVNNAFKHNLQRMSPMEVWAEWLESIVDQVLAKYHDKPSSVVSNVGKQFLLNWSFYTSMIIRDLTLRSAMSFGSFTLIRLLADDYMYYLIESKIAKAGKQQLITVIRQDKDWPLAQNTQEYIVPSNDEDQDDKKSCH